MTDIARLGFSADTSALKNARADLEKLVPAAKRAEQATDRFNKAAAGITAGSGGAAAGIKSFSAAASGAAMGTDRLSKAALASGTAMGTVGRAAAGAAAPLANLVATTARVGTTFQQADAHVEAYKASLAGVPAAAAGATSSLNRLGAAANDNINRLQSTPGNIAAQFQDIGVTAAGGMDPLLIALQQGTQLSSAMAGGIGNLFAGFRELFTLTTILTVGLVGLAAAGLQAVDWMALARTLSLALADVLEEVALAAAYLGVVLAIAFAPRLLALIASTTASIGVALVGAIKTATAAMIAFAIANPFAAVVLAIGLVIGAMIVLNDTFGGVFTDILATVKNVANAIIRFFAIAFNAVIQRAQSAANGIVSIFNSVSGALGFDVKVGQVDFSGAQINTDPGRDFVGEGVNFVRNAASRGAGFLRNAFAPEAAEGKTEKAARGSTGQTEAEKQAEAYEDLTMKARARVAELVNEAKALGMSEFAARKFRNEQDLLAQAAEQNIKLTADQKNELMLLAGAISQSEIAVEIREMTNAFNEQKQALSDQADLIGLSGLELEYNAQRQRLFNDAVSRGIIDVNNMDDAMRAYVATLGDQALVLAQGAEANRGAEFVANLTADLAVQTDALMRQRGEWGLTGAALTAYRIESQLLNDAIRQGIELSPAQVAAIGEQARAYSMVNEEVTEQQELMDISRQTLRSFFGDLIGNLQQGQSAWQAFGNAVLNVVNSIIDRLLDFAADQAFNAILSAFGGASPQASLLDDANSTIAANPDIFAKGGAFDGGVQKFAKGGAFTNGVFSNPTMFKFANGGKFGVMGEAGPEAVMPLKRGPDGSLGVQVQAMEPQMVTVRIVTDDERFDAYVDDRIDASAPTIARAGSVISSRETAFTNSRRLSSR
jgi:hypothetical protein